MRYAQIIEADNRVPARLYHGTSIFNLVSILQTNRLTGTGQYGTDDGPDGVSLTAEIKVAHHFAERAADVWYEINYHDLPDDLYDRLPKGGAVLTLNGLALSRHYHVMPYHDENQPDQIKEQEWRVMTPNGSLSPVTSYLMMFSASSSEIAWFSDLLRKYPNAGWGNERPEDIESLLGDPRYHSVG